MISRGTDPDAVRVLICSAILLGSLRWIGCAIAVLAPWLWSGFLTLIVQISFLKFARTEKGQSMARDPVSRSRFVSFKPCRALYFPPRSH